MGARIAHCLRFLVEAGCCRRSRHCFAEAGATGHPWSADTTWVAAKHGHLDCLRYAVQAGVLCDGWSYDTTWVAASHGQLECLRFAVEAGCPWHPDTTEAAASHGHLDCLRYAVEAGCSWSAGTTSAAARYGHLDCLRFAAEAGVLSHSCSWHLHTTYAAARNGHLECLRYAVQTGRPWSTPGSETAVVHLAKGACRVWLEAARGAVDIIGSRRRRVVTFAMCLNRLLPKDVVGLVLRHIEKSGGIHRHGLP